MLKKENILHFKILAMSTLTIEYNIYYYFPCLKDLKYLDLSLTKNEQ